MGRVVKDWREGRVDETQLAPHRYTWDGANQSDPEAPTFKAWKASIPYREGEAVYVERDGVAVRALIHIVMLHGRNRWGERQEAYKVQFETANGTWSKLWNLVYPGQIQRGYKLAGLAPDIPE